jgi:hypothetical protein
MRTTLLTLTGNRFLRIAPIVFLVAILAGSGEGAPSFAVKIEFQSNGWCRIGQGQNVRARNTNVGKTVRATIQATTDPFSSPGYPRQDVVTISPGGRQQVGCERIPDSPMSINYQVVGEE